MNQIDFENYQLWLAKESLNFLRYFHKFKTKKLYICKVTLQQRGAVWIDYSPNTETWLFISQVVSLILELSFSMENTGNTNHTKYW